MFSTNLYQKPSLTSGSSKLATLAKQVSFLKNLPEKLLDTILNVSTLFNKPKNTILFLQGDPADSFYILIKGIAGSYLQTEDGKQIFLKLIPEGGHFGKTSLLPNSYYPYTIETISECSFLKIPFYLLRKYLLQNPETTQNLMVALIYSLHEHVAHIGKQHSLSAAQRLACYLLKSVNGHTGNEISIPLSINKSTIADYLQMTPETFSRATLKLKVIGVEFKKSYVFVKDVKVLSNFCCCSCSRISSPLEQECSSNLISS